MLVKLNLSQQLENGSISLDFQVKLTKHNRENAVGTICNEVCQGLRAMKQARCKGIIKSNKPVDIRLTMGDHSINTKFLDNSSRVSVLRNMALNLRIKAGDAKSEGQFFALMLQMFDFMLSDVKEMTDKEFFALKNEEATIAAIAKKQAKIELEELCAN